MKSEAKWYLNQLIRLKEDRANAKHICARCAIEFTGRKKKYCNKCSTELRNERAKISSASAKQKRENILRKCNCCGKEYKLKGKGKFCSNECSNIFHSRKRSIITKHDNVIRYCLKCGNTFRPINNNHKCCTEKCGQQNRSERGLPSRRQREQLKRNTIPSWKLDKNMATLVWHCLKKKKGLRSWKKLVNYSIEQLITHLEGQFKDGMTWDNYGKWHVDHIIPRSKFDFNDINQFNECWKLDNLQPLWGVDNISKGNRI